MTQIKTSRKVRNAVVLNKRTAAFLIYGAKNGQTDSLLSNSPGLGTNWNAIASLKKRRKLFSPEGAAPSNGAAPFSHSTKNNRFRRKTVNAFCNSLIQPGIFRLRCRTPELRILLCAGRLTTSAHLYLPRAPPASEIKVFTPISEEQEVCPMARQYLRKAEPYDQNPNSNWIVMTGSEFYQFINSPEGRMRYFIIWDDLVIEAPMDQYNEWLCEDEHYGYLRQFENGWNTIFLYSDLAQDGKDGEGMIPDPAVDVERSAIANIRRNALIAALRCLDYQSFYLIYSLYLARHTKTESKLAKEVGISQQAISKRKEKILRKLKFLVVKCEKSPQ